ncbi:hypothetical protein [Streptomyces canus]
MTRKSWARENMVPAAKMYPCSAAIVMTWQGERTFRLLHFVERGN